MTSSQQTTTGVAARFVRRAGTAAERISRRALLAGGGALAALATFALLPRRRARARQGGFTVVPLTREELYRDHDLLG